MTDLKAELISIGDELLIGQVINSNAAWMGQKLSDVGVEVRQITCVSDSEQEIVRALKDAEQRADVILMTGGLGPTHDDITKDVLCRYFNTELIMNNEVLGCIRSFFLRKGLPLTQLNQDQALVPQSAIVVLNPIGTAPGLAFERAGRLFVAMPGVPYEMKHIMESWVLPRLTEMNGGHAFLHQTVLTQGIGESFLAVKIADWVSQLPEGVRLAYLPSPGMVRLRLSIRGSDKQSMGQVLNKQIQLLKSLIPEYFWGLNEEKLEQLAGEMLKEKGHTLATAESCTGGYIAHRITGVPGSSSWFKGSVVAYDNSVKENMLGVTSETIARKGAVSKEVVEQMAEGAIKVLKTDYAIAVSGIAGPDGGTEQKPVGTVWVAVASKERVGSKEFLFGDERERNIIRAGTAALAMFLNFLKE